ncbi:Protein tesmin/TSO1-like CXC 5 [Porphyridium purpureum]|uniref:Protein tesmin/TSO1-like CXC 5 n=1 Tax=Porphyridium purpureum TaxID=35688 RepID=A0A5J4YN57_PORPP|nr:Protein tesmin/TSO1-like CXC 5 [Porphyridium purpureum]|eukprot:POR9271..scf295_9
MAGPAVPVHSGGRAVVENAAAAKEAFEGLTSPFRKEGHESASVSVSPHALKEGGARAAHGLRGSEFVEIEMQRNAPQDHDQDQIHTPTTSDGVRMKGASTLRCEKGKGSAASGNPAVESSETTSEASGAKRESEFRRHLQQAAHQGHGPGLPSHEQAKSAETRESPHRSDQASYESSASFPPEASLLRIRNNVNDHSLADHALSVLARAGEIEVARSLQNTPAKRTKSARGTPRKATKSITKKNGAAVSPLDTLTPVKQPQSKRTSHVIPSPKQIVGGADSARARLTEGAGAGPSRTCSCVRSQCIQQYCVCFKAGGVCSPHCTCNNCLNNENNEALREARISQVQERYPLAFTSKVLAAHVEGGTKPVMVHARGCHCLKSHCLKGYCECFEAGTVCSDRCVCVNCKNFAGSEELEAKNCDKASDLGRNSMAGSEMSLERKPRNKKRARGRRVPDMDDSTSERPRDPSPHSRPSSVQSPVQSVAARGLGELNAEPVVGASDSSKSIEKVVPLEIVKDDIADLMRLARDLGAKENDQQASWVHRVSVVPSCFMHMICRGLRGGIFTPVKLSIHQIRESAQKKRELLLDILVLDAAQPGVLAHAALDIRLTPHGGALFSTMRRTGRIRGSTSCFSAVLQ